MGFEYNGDYFEGVKLTYWIFGASGKIGRELLDLAIQENFVVAFVGSNESKESIENVYDSSRIKVVTIDLASTRDIQKILAISEDHDFAPRQIVVSSRGRVALDNSESNENWINEVERDARISMYMPLRIISKILDTSTKELNSVIFLSSQYAMVAQDPDLYEHPDLSMSLTYSAIRGGVISAIRGLAVKGSKVGVDVNTLTIGGILESTPRPLAERIAARLPTRRMLKSDQVARTIYAFSKLENSGIVGTSIVIDNGWTLI